MDGCNYCKVWRECFAWQMNKDPVFPEELKPLSACEYDNEVDYLMKVLEAV